MAGLSQLAEPSLIRLINLNLDESNGDALILKCVHRKEVYQGDAVARREQMNKQTYSLYRYYYYCGSPLARRDGVAAMKGCLSAMII